MNIEGVCLLEAVFKFHEVFLSYVNVYQLRPSDTFILGQDANPISVKKSSYLPSAAPPPLHLPDCVHTYMYRDIQVAHLFPNIIPGHASAYEFNLAMTKTSGDDIHRKIEQRLLYLPPATSQGKPTFPHKHVVSLTVYMYL